MRLRLRAGSQLGLVKAIEIICKELVVNMALTAPMASRISTLRPNGFNGGIVR